MTSRLIRQPVKLTLLALCAALVITWGVSVDTQAQALYGSITGRVVDSTGGAIPGAEVTVLNPATNFTQTTLTNDVGVYSLPNLPDGSYTLTVSLTGFKNAVSEGVRVEVGTLTRENVVLQVGEITESITVSSAATVLKTDTTDVSAQLDAAEIQDLPMGAFRNYQSLINLVPGATAARFQNAITDTPGRALSTNINGTNRNSNNTRIDGAISVNIWLPHHTAYVPPSETIEVVDISTNNFDAEKGFAGGAATTVITKSGTNEVHGSAWWYHENSALNARDFFNFLDEDGDGKADKPSGRRHMWGGTVGGPIVKDKVFYFVGFEATQQARGTTATSTLPTDAMRGGDFSAFLPEDPSVELSPCPNDPTGEDCTVIYDPLTGSENRQMFAGNIVPSDRFNDSAMAMLDLVPSANLPGTTSNHEVSGQEIMNRYNTDIKGDWYRTDAHRLWGKFSWMDAQVKNNSRFGLGGGGAIGSAGDGVGDTDVRVYGIGQTWTLSPTFLLDTNFGFTDMDQQVLGADFGLGNFGQDVLGIPGTNAAEGQDQACIIDGQNRCAGTPRFSVSGYSTWGQTDGWTPIFRDEDSLTFTQNFSWTRGSHELRFGFDLVRHQMNHWQPEIGAGPRGRFNFSDETTADVDGGGRDQNAFAAYLLGLNSYSGKSLQWEEMTTNEWQSAFYIRDRWQVTPKLTLTLGLRWEYYPLMSRWDRPMEFMPVNQTVPCNPADNSEGPDCRSVILDNNISVSKKLFAPRLGIAYRLSDNDVFRMGYGVTYSPIPFSRPLRGFYPLTIAGNFDASNAFTTDLSLGEGVPLFTGPDTAAGSSSPIPSYVDMRTMPFDKINRGYIQSWNVMYERKLPSDFVMSLGYVGTQTTRQLADNMLNWAGPSTEGSTERRQEYPIRTTNTRYWDGWLSGNYHSLQLAVNRRFTGGLFVKGAYTWGRAINRSDDEGWAGLSWNDPGLMSRNRAQAGYNRPHTLQIATVYELPFGQDGDDFGSKIARNWQTNFIFSINQNSPATIGGSSPLNTASNSATADQIGEINKLGGIGEDDPYYDTSSFQNVSDRPGSGDEGEYLPGTDCDNSDGSWDCYGNVGRNMIRGPAWVNLDFSIFRLFQLTEGTQLEFRSEFFNLTNTPHFNNPNFSASSSAFMEISGTSSNAPERVIRFALKLRF